MDTAVIDIDGTLLDSNYHHALAWSRAFAHAGHPAPAWRIHRAIGMGGDRLVAAVSGDAVEEAAGADIRDRWEVEYDAMIDETRLLDGARELLAGFRAAGLQVVLASSGIPRHAEHALELLDARSSADAWTTSEDAEESKPDPELLDRALAQVADGRAFMVGDSTWDVAAASARDLPTVGVLTGGFGRAELLEAGAVAVYDGPRELLGDLADLLPRLLPPR